ncbi:hypothetical protein EMIHUDRAFT_118273 [Emiliania huxleyi CCMP1516]|uniref:Uncharacterized protein n=2 Tax=Emiliania huxleyi TaxID=2903 RepID=A0A0D3J634_EMIH1|nr:hypothetical protein EMIHUDRAFT_118273 [Emiliania huxleyi CCMP1516]EOD18969.1 hypothetical protein EMIHUDRAFT_118273 [Emiliania huxleyi CCMP1516]|eukprot:XP_005771398.1 hypothetical protein EMIHUDRAFT_118273 [Emiliania huxleyi CCMP1516]
MDLSALVAARKRERPRTLLGRAVSSQPTKQVRKSPASEAPRPSCSAAQKRPNAPPRALNSQSGATAGQRAPPDPAPPAQGREEIPPRRFYGEPRAAPRAEDSASSQPAPTSLVVRLTAAQKEDLLTERVNMSVAAAVALRAPKRSAETWSAVAKCSPTSGAMDLFVWRYITPTWTLEAQARPKVRQWSTNSQSVLRATLDLLSARGSFKAMYDVKVLVPNKDRPSTMVAAGVVPATFSVITSARKTVTIVLRMKMAYFNAVSSAVGDLQVCAPHPQQGPIPAFEGYGESGLLTQEALKEEIKQSIRLMVSTRPAWGKYLDPRLLTAARRTPEQEAAAARQEATRVERLAGGAEADEDATQPSASPASVLAESGTPHRPSQASTIRAL